MDALISQTRRLRGEVDAVRRDAVADEDDPQQRWQRALCDLAVHQLDDLGAQLGQLRAGVPVEVPPGTEGGGRTSTTRGSRPIPAPRTARPHRRALARCSPGRQRRVEPAHRRGELVRELYQIFGRTRESGPMSLDEMPTMVFAEDQPLLQGMVTDCLIDGKPIDGEFRIVRTDGRVRTVHMTGEPVLDADGCTASMWAVLRDVSELRRSQRAVRESRAGLERSRDIERTERRVAVELQEAVLPPWRGSLHFAHGGPAPLDVAAHYLRPPAPD